MTDPIDDPRRPASRGSWTATLILSTLGLLSFLARAFIDFRFVYAELGLEAGALGFAILIHLAVVGGWIWAIVAASRGRRAMYVLLGYAVMLVLWGLYTILALCPSPCRTGWSAGEISIWSNLVIGAATAALAAVALFRRT
jgi:hypothetical protein